jgi:hypothetical protein
VSLNTVPPLSGAYATTCLKGEINNSYIHLEGDLAADTSPTIIAEDIHDSTLDLRNINLCRKTSISENTNIDCKVLNSSC